MDTVFARIEHGGFRVTLSEEGYRVDWPDGSKTYPSARKTIIALVNRAPDPTPKAYDPHLTFDRYFRRGRYRKPEPVVDTLTLFGKAESDALGASPKGFDLARRALEVRKIFYAGFGRRVAKMGYDPEDVLQEVYQGLLIRNSGKCPFDETKSSFGHYVHMVTGCILSNYHRKQARLADNESFGVKLSGEDTIDVAEADLLVADATQEEDLSFLRTRSRLSQVLKREARRIGVEASFAATCLNLLSEGRKTREIAEITGASMGAVSKTVRLVRDVATNVLSPASAEA